jgi:ELWxxDGT repeat protein
MLLRHIALAAAILFAPIASARDAVESRFTVAGAYAYFQANGELWRTDGTERGTIRLSRERMRITDVEPHGAGAFVAVDRGRHSELWFTEGTRDSTRRVANLGEVFVSSLTSFGAQLLFTVMQRPNGTNPALWRSDGTAEGTTHMTPLIGVAFYTKVAGKYVYLAIAHEDAGHLWRTDGTKAGTVSLETRTTGVFAAIGDKLLFDGPGALWRSDGTVEGTRIVKGMIPPREIVSNGRIAYAATSEGFYRTDGTNSGTTRHSTFRERELAMVGDGVAFSDTKAVVVFRGPGLGFERHPIDFDPAKIIVSNDAIYALGGFEQLQRAGAPAPIPVRVQINSAVAFAGEVLFSGSDRWRGYEPWMTSGTPESTRMIANINREGGVRGSVRDAETGEYVRNAILYLNDGYFFLPRGPFTIDGLVGHEYTVRVEAPGYVSQSWNGGAPILVPLDGTYDGVHFLLRRSGVITGRVTNTNGEPLQTNVKITSITTGTTNEVATNAQGSYSIEVSPDEWYVLETTTTPRVIYSSIVCSTYCNAVGDGTRVRPRSGEVLRGIDFIVPQ